VSPFDRFNNTLPTATGYAVSINDDPPTPLLPPSFSHTHLIPARFSGSLSLDFTLDGAPIANSPVTVTVFPDWSIVYVGTVLGMLLLLGSIVFFLYRRLQKGKILKMNSRVDEVRLSEKKLLIVKAQLEEEVRLKKHSEEELKVMVAALEAVSQERQDELKEVMIDSQELKIDRLLGKGG
jgi:hypothetical protein